MLQFMKEIQNANSDEFNSFYFLILIPPSNKQSNIFKERSYTAKNKKHAHKGYKFITQREKLILFTIAKGVAIIYTKFLSSSTIIPAIREYDHGSKQSPYPKI